MVKRSSILKDIEWKDEVGLGGGMEGEKEKGGRKERKDEGPHMWLTPVQSLGSI